MQSQQKPSNRIKDHLVDYSLAHTVSTVRSRTKPYPQRSGLQKTPEPSKKPGSFHTLEHYQSSSGRKSQTGSKCQSAKTISFVSSGWACYRLPMLIHSSSHIECPMTLPSRQFQRQKFFEKQGGTAYPAILREVDIDKECLDNLEEEMSERAE